LGGNPEIIAEAGGGPEPGGGVGGLCACARGEEVGLWDCDGGDIMCHQLIWTTSASGFDRIWAVTEIFISDPGASMSPPQTSARVTVSGNWGT
jgi:hypothetical protein